MVLGQNLVRFSVRFDYEAKKLNCGAMDRYGQLHFECINTLSYLNIELFGLKVHVYCPGWHCFKIPLCLRSSSVAIVIISVLQAPHFSTNCSLRPNELIST